MNAKILSLGGFFALFLVWVVASALVGNPLLMPTPWATAMAFAGLFTTTLTLQAMLGTALRLLLALTFAATTGIFTGVAAGLSPSVYRFLHPIVTVFRTVPVISVVVIVLILFGFASTPYVITFLMVFPILYQGTADGIRRIDAELVDVYRLEDDSLLGGIRHCYLPLIAADLRTALLQAAGLGVKVLVMAEYLAQTPVSVGNALYLAKVNLDFAGVFAWTVLLVLMAAAIEAFVRRGVNRRTRPVAVQPRSAGD